MNYAANSQQCLQNILAEVNFSGLSKRKQTQFKAQLTQHFDELFGGFVHLYGHQYDCYWHLKTLVETLRDGFNQRSQDLITQDRKRSNGDPWYQAHKQVGMACYVDLLGPTLQDLVGRIDYFKQLGVTYLHLMPLYAVPEGDSDGGYAVADYRKVNPTLGTVKDLEILSAELRKAGIDLVLDFVFNHTSDEHAWALAAQQGDAKYRDYYYTFPDRTMPDAYEQHLREIFPQVRRGCFTFREDMQAWVWTTFNSFQWDLNYRNPAVFNAITSEMLFLANLGCSALRLDALAFIWKELGTDCENQPNAHRLIQTFNLCLKIVAPSVVFKSEAIVHPDEVVKYIAPHECELSYNPLLMALLWNSLATRKTRLLKQSMKKSLPIDEQCRWVNYVRCHDDIGWTFDDHIAGQLGINGFDHRQFLNQFYTGRFEGSFATGVAFAENPTTGDCRVCGELASLCGLERAVNNDDKPAALDALARITLLHSVIMSIGGIPLLYSGDELGLFNDYSYQNDPDKQHDDRWVNRVAVTPNDIATLTLPATAKDGLELWAHRSVYHNIRELISVRKSLPILAAPGTRIIDTTNDHVFAYSKQDDEQTLICVCNFSEHAQRVDLLNAPSADLKDAKVIYSSEANWAGADSALSLAAYQVVWLLITKN